jgi:hypothetical protein
MVIGTVTQCSEPEPGSGHQINRPEGDAVLEAYATATITRLLEDPRVAREIPDKEIKHHKESRGFGDLSKRDRGSGPLRGRLAANARQPASGSQEPRARRDADTPGTAVEVVHRWLPPPGPGASRGTLLLSKRKSTVRTDPDSDCVSKRHGSACLWRERNAKDTTVLPNVGPTSAKIVGELLGSHPEAESLLAEPSHRRALAASSATESGPEIRCGTGREARLRNAKASARARHARLVHLDIGLLLLVTPSVGIVMFSLYELSGLRSGVASGVPLALAASTVWLTLAWLVPAVRRRALAAALILGLAAGASAVIDRHEPASLLAPRRRWHRARSDYDETERTRQADLEAAAIESEGWLELVTVGVIKVSDGDEQLVKKPRPLPLTCLRQTDHSFGQQARAPVVFCKGWSRSFAAKLSSELRDIADRRRYRCATPFDHGDQPAEPGVS